MEAIIRFLFSFIFLSINLYSKEYKDFFGRTINIEKTPEKIITIGPGALRLVSYLDGVDKIIATENIEIKFPQGRPYTLAYYDKIKNLPVIGEGGPDKLPDFEKIISLKPDLIITCSLDSQIISQIELKTKIKVFAMDYGNLGTFDVHKFKDALIILGRVLGKEKRALELNKKIDEYLSDLNKRTKDIKNKPSVYVGGLGFKGSHGITSTQISYPSFKLLGLKNIIDENNSNALHIFIDKEKLIKLNPDYIFIDGGGFSIIEMDYKTNKNYYEILNAFKNLNVYTTLPYNYYTTNVEIVFINTYFIGKVLFPDRFKDVGIRKKANDILKTFLKKDVYDELTKDYEYRKIKNKEFEFEKI